jgi:hypothetical protein
MLCLHHLFHRIRRCTSSVQCWTVLAKSLTLTDECIIGAAAADILGDVGISSLPRILSFWNRPALVAWPLSFLPTLTSRFPLLFTSARTETKPDVLEQWIYVHFSIAVPLPFNITSTPCSRSMPHNSHPTHTSSSPGVKDISTAHVSATWMASRRSMAVVGGQHDATRCGDGDRAWCRQKLAGCYSAVRWYLSRSYSSFT